MVPKDGPGVHKRMGARKLTPESEIIRRRQRLRKMNRELKEIREDLSASNIALEELKTRAFDKVKAFNELPKRGDLNAEEREKRTRILTEIKGLAAEIGKTGREALRLRERKRKIKEELDESGLIV